MLLAAGLVGLLVALGCSAAVVFPRLHRRAAQRTDDGLYFGELAGWTASALASRLMTMTGTERLDGLSRQLVATSRIAWGKHRLLQASLIVTAPSAVLLTLGALL